MRSISTILVGTCIVIIMFLVMMQTFSQAFGLFSVQEVTNEEQTGILVDVFKTNVRGVISTIRLTYATTGQIEGLVEDLQLSGISMTGNWKLDIETNEITLTNISDGKYCIKELLSSKANADFSVKNDCEGF